MVGYNRGSGGGSGGGDSDYTKDTMTPQTGLKGFTFHAGRSKKQQVGEIPTFDGILQIGNAGTEKHTITPNLEKRYIGKGVYLSQDIEINPMSRGSLTLSFNDDAGSVRVYPSTNGYVDSSSGKTFDLGGRRKIYYEEWYVPEEYDEDDVLDDVTIKEISNLDFEPSGACIFCTVDITSSDCEDFGNAHEGDDPCLCSYMAGTKHWSDDYNESGYLYFRGVYFGRLDGDFASSTLDDSNSACIIRSKRNDDGTFNIRFRFDVSGCSDSFFPGEKYIIIIW